MKHTKVLFVFCLLTAGLLQNAHAQGNNFLWVYGTSDNIQSFALNDLQKITFTGQDMVIKPASGAAVNFSYSSVSKWIFAPSAFTDIAPVVADTEGANIYYRSTTESVVLQSASVIGEVSVFNLQGVLFKRVVVQTVQAEIALSGIPAGVYIVKTGTSVKKIIKN
jgi:hypothetical protein